MWFGGGCVQLGILLGAYTLTATYLQAPPAPESTQATARTAGEPSRQVQSRGPGRRASVKSTPTAPVAGSRPRRVAMPSLGIDAPVDPIRTADGVLVPPADPSRLGWWEDGARPGDPRGSVLITGHTVHSGGGAMDHLGDLVPGDLVRIDTVRRPLAYRVVQVTYYPKQTLTELADEVFRQSGRPRLVLVTCERWDGTAYAGNTVVVAEPERG